MMELFYMGGSLFMSILTIIFVVMVAVSIINGMAILNGNISGPEDISRRLSYTKSIGLFALIIGMLGQLIGLFSAFEAIELGAVQVSPALLAGGFKVSMITTLYGMLIYALSFMVWFALNLSLGKK